MNTKLLQKKQFGLEVVAQTGPCVNHFHGGTKMITSGKQLPTNVGQV